VGAIAIIWYGHMFFTNTSRATFVVEGMNRIPGHQLLLLQEPQYLKESCFQFLLLFLLLYS